MDRERIVEAVIAAAGGEIIGRVRLQKTVYLLDQLGLNSKFDYEYHNYGPYSTDLTAATADAIAFGLIEEDFENRRSDGAQYSVFRNQGDNDSTAYDAAYGRIGKERTVELVDLMNQYSATVLELAATVDWLWRYERRTDWREEIQKRKGVKTAEGRLDLAVELLRELGLDPERTKARSALGRSS